MAPIDTGNALAKHSWTVLSWSDPDTTQQGVTLDGADGSVRGSGDAGEAESGDSGPAAVASGSDAVASSSGDQSVGAADADCTTSEPLDPSRPSVRALVHCTMQR